MIPVATGVLRPDLQQLRQGRDETFRAFTTSVRGKAETCANCECGKSVDYTRHAIRDVLLNGMHDTDILREVLGIKDMLKTPVIDVLSLVEKRK